MGDLNTQEEINAIRVATVNKDGRDSGFSSLGDRLAALRPGGFVAIDTEFSGLGKDRDVGHENLQIRYAAIRRLANTRAIFSAGISIFNPVDVIGNVDVKSGSDRSEYVPSKPTYDVATYDLLLSCQSVFEMSPSSGEFLVSHGFDFNRMFRMGIPYHRASTEENMSNIDETDTTTAPPPLSSETLSWKWAKLPRGLLWRIGRFNVPIIVHNGLFDLIFLYAAFQSSLPESLNDFVSALLDCVPAGFWDSKVITSSANNRPSFLAYIFAKSVLASAIHVSSSKTLPSADLTNPAEMIFSGSPNILCALFAFRGFCPRGTACPFSHDAFKIIEEEKCGQSANDAKEAYKRHRAQSKIWKRRKDDAKLQTTLSKKQRKKLQVNATSSSDTVMAASALTTVTSEANSGGVVNSAHDPVDTDDSDTLVTNGQNAHSAGWDAFCTGYIFGVYRATLPPETLQKHHNYIALSNKLSDLLLRRSEYAYLDNPTLTPKQPSLSDSKPDGDLINATNAHQ